MQNRKKVYLKKKKEKLVPKILSLFDINLKGLATSNFRFVTFAKKKKKKHKQ